MTGYFKEINQGIDALLAEDVRKIHLSAEMRPFERKLNAVKQTLEKQKQETALAEQRKDELVMYLAHDIRTPLTGAAGYIELSLVLSPHGNSIVLNVDENLTVCADPNKLVRVFSNILKNAAAYSFPDTDIIISSEETEGQVWLRFQNEGNNIPKESLTSLFDKFYRLDKARISDTGGTGLGLAIAKEIILLHGGDIYASNGK